MNVLKKAFTKEPLGMFAAITALLTAGITVAPFLSKVHFSVISECSPITPESLVIGGSGGFGGAGGLYVDAKCRLINAENVDVGIVDIVTVPSWYNGDGNPMRTDESVRQSILDNTEYFENPEIIRSLSSAEFQFVFGIIHSAKLSRRTVGEGKYAASLAHETPITLNEIYNAAFESDAGCHRESMSLNQALRDLFQSEGEYYCVKLRLANDQIIEIFPEFSGTFYGTGLPLVGTPTCPELSMTP